MHARIVVYYFRGDYADLDNCPPSVAMIDTRGKG
jgi:hypothetical protein